MKTFMKSAWIKTKGDTLNKLTPNDLYFIASRLPKDVKDLIKSHPGLMIAGGFIRAIIAGEKISDIDIFGPNEEVLSIAAQEIAANRGSRVHETNNAITVVTLSRMPLQFITRWKYAKAEDLINSFDYTICQALITMEDGAWVSYCSDMFYPDLAARRLNYTSPMRNEDAGGSILRMRKFLSKGYTIQVDSMARVIARLISGIDSKDEQSDAKVISRLLREVDPLRIIDGVEIASE